jgi:hypothetical protein
VGKFGIGIKLPDELLKELLNDDEDAGIFRLPLQRCAY